MESWTHSYCYECFSSVIHHPFCKISNNVLFSCCSPFGIQPCFQAHPQIGVVSVHSSNSLYFLLPFGNNGICFLQNPILPTELGFIHNPLTQKIFFWDRMKLTKLVSSQMQVSAGSVCTPINLWVVYNKHERSAYFLFIRQLYFQSHFILYSNFSIVFFDEAYNHSLSLTFIYSSFSPQTSFEYISFGK